MGTSNADDAGVYRITGDIAAVLTTDFFTPIVDDPYSFGAIAAANSLSDVYAMGGKPLTALNIAMFPDHPDFFPTLKKIMQGGIDKMAEAGVSVIGGHTIKDKEPKYGFAVLGIIHPDKVLDNSKARGGDAIILTKKIGTGVISTGVKAGICPDAVIEDFTKSMAGLNKRASEIMMEVGVSTATDVTGFGLIGHLIEVLTASRLGARIFSGRVPFFEDAIRLIGLGKVPGGTMANIRSFSSSVRFEKEVADAQKVLLHDAQTSGGLLIFVPAGKKERLIDAMQAEGILAADIGYTLEGPKDEVRIIAEK